jgi:hypothetical protein
LGAKICKSVHAKKGRCWAQYNENDELIIFHSGTFPKGTH